MGSRVWLWIKGKAEAANLADWIMAASTVTIAFLTFFYVCYAGKQWDVMERQLTELIKQVDTTIAMDRPSLELVPALDEKTNKPVQLSGNGLTVDENGNGTVNFTPIRWQNAGRLPVIAPTAELHAFITSDGRTATVGPKIEEKLNVFCSAEGVTTPITQRGKIHRTEEILIFPPAAVGLFPVPLEKIDDDAIKIPGPTYIWMTACIRYPLVSNGKKEAIQENVWRLYTTAPGKGNTYGFPVPRKPLPPDPKHPDNIAMELTEYGKYQ